jgi:predicted nuclease of restriction endonuclease-like (RecB) superfamily
MTKLTKTSSSLKMANWLPTGYGKLLREIKARIRSAQYEALKAVNRHLVALYWDIGQMIAARQKGESWGQAVVETLAADLRKEFPGIQGFSARNIWYMRSFYLTYVRKPKLQPLVAEIGWTHNLVVLDKCRADIQREFYIRMTRKFGWTKDVLALQIVTTSPMRRLC